MNGWVIVESCVNCGGEVEQYKTVITAPSLMVDFCGGVLPVLTPSNYVKCSVCGLVMQSPRMTDERIAQYYSSGLYRQTLGIPVEQMDADELARAKDVAAWLKAQGVQPKSHIDIGASRNYLSREIGAPIVRGVDINPEYGSTESKAGWFGDYELVTAIHVLEHVTNPKREIAWYKSLSSDKVLIEVPGVNCTGGPLRFAHLYYFLPAVLCAMIEVAGMKILKVELNPNTRVLAQI